jgi:DNA-binding transcriptional regulator YbjK
VIERDGVAGVTHRRVAREADVPTTSTTYYFSCLDDLLIATLTWCADKMAEDIAPVVFRPAEIARLLAEAVGPHRGRTLAEYELYLLAARRPELRPAARRWIDVITDVAGPHSDDPMALRAFLAAVDGLLVQGLIADDPPTAADLEPVVSHLMRHRTMNT